MVHVLAHRCYKMSSIENSKKKKKLAPLSFDFFSIAEAKNYYIVVQNKQPGIVADKNVWKISRIREQLPSLWVYLMSSFSYLPLATHSNAKNFADYPAVMHRQ